MSLGVEARVDPLRQTDLRLQGVSLLQKVLVPVLQTLHPVLHDLVLFSQLAVLDLLLLLRLQQVRVLLPQRLELGLKI